MKDKKRLGAYMALGAL
jgi:hypothetical protein